MKKLYNLLFILFSFFTFSIVNAQTEIGFYPKSNPSNKYSSVQNSMSITTDFGTSNLNTLGVYYIGDYKIVENSTYIFQLKVAVTLEPDYSTTVVSNSIPDCTTFAMSPVVKIPYRTGTSQQLKKWSFDKTYCSYDGFKSEAVFTFFAEFTASENSDYLTFLSNFVSPSWTTTNKGIDISLKFSDVKLSLVSLDNSNVINNQNQNKNDIINNNNTNKNEIINNQEQNKNDIIDNQNKNQEETNDKLDEAENTRKGILGFIQNIFDGIVHLPENIWNFIKGGFELIGNAITGLFDGLKGIFLPEPVCKTSPNLLPTNKDSYTQYGITITKNEDGSFTLNGTASVNASLYLYQGENITLAPGTYTGSSFTNRSVFIRLNNGDYKQLSGPNFKTNTFTIDSSFTFNNLYIYVSKNYTFNNEIIKPILVEGSSIGQFEPFGEFCEKTSFWTWFQRLGDMIGNFFSGLLNGILDGLKALFIPSDDYFTNKFDELTDKVEQKMGVLAYPLTITIRTFEFLLTVNDTGSYVISWNDITVPNFEEYVIIKKGSFDLSDLLKNVWIKMAHTLYMTFVSAYLLLAFFKFCNNKYSDMFGGDYDNTDYIVVEESIVDVHDTENGKRYVNHKERRYKVGDE